MIGMRVPVFHNVALLNHLLGDLLCKLSSQPQDAKRRALDQQMRGVKHRRDENHTHATVDSEPLVVKGALHGLQ